MRKKGYWVHCLLPTFLVFCGCASTPSQEKDVWIGDITRYAGDQRENELVDYSAPRIKALQWSYENACLEVILEQNKTFSFDLMEHRQVFDIYRRTRDSKHVRKDNKFAAIALLPITLADYVEERNDYKEALKAADEGAIAAFQSGEESYGVQLSFPDPKHEGYDAYVYRQEFKEDTYLVKAEDQQLRENVCAVNVPVKVVGLVTGDSQTHRTDKQGVARVSLCQSLGDSLALLPGELDVAVRWEDEWVTVGSASLTGDGIRRIVQGRQSSSMAQTGVPDLPPFAEASVDVPAEDIRADTHCTLSLHIKNTGKGEFYQLVATSESLVPSLDGLRFEFGQLDPNDKLTLSKQVHIPRGQATGPANVTFTWSELNGYEPDPLHNQIKVQGLHRPSFATRLQVLDDKSGKSVGNKDGRIQKGEAVDLVVTIKNMGEGSAQDVLVSLSAPEVEGVIINVSEQSIGSIEPGETKQARLTITTKKSAKINSLHPSISILDRFLGLEHKEHHTLALEEELGTPVLVYDGLVYVGKDEIVVHSGAGSATPLMARAQRGSVLQATGSLKGWIRVDIPKIGTGWVQRSKIAFERFPFSLEGSHVIEITEKAPPLILITEPMDGKTFRESRIKVSGFITDSQSLEEIVIRINGREIIEEDKRAIGLAPSKQTGRRHKRLDFEVELQEGENEIAIAAWDNDGMQDSETLTLTYEKDQGEVYVACIGVDAYHKVRQLKYAADDAQAVAECMRLRLGVPEENVSVLLNDEATLANIKSTLGVKLRQRVRKEDTVIIFFSGHGAPEADPHSEDADGIAKYLLPVDADMETLYSSALPMREVSNIFRRLISERVIFIADTCYSGAAGGRTLMPDGTQYRSINQNNLMVRLRNTGKGRIILTASQGSEVSQEKDEFGHGVFTYYLLHGLHGKADTDQDKKVTINELYDYVYQEVPKATKNTQHPMMDLDEMVGNVVVSVLDGTESVRQ